MRSIKKRHQLAIVFSLYFFGFLFVFSALFITSFRIVFTHQLKNELSHELSEITANFLKVTDGGIDFKRNQDNETLKQFLYSEGISAIFYDSKGNELRHYGIYTLNAAAEDHDDLKKLVLHAIDKKSVQEKNALWNKQEFTTYIAPVIYAQKPVGAMVISKSANTSDQTIQLMIFVLASLGLIGLLGSFFVGYFFSYKLFSPLKDMAKTIEDIDLEQLDETIKVKGHPKDEIVILTKKFNEMIIRLKDMTSRQKEFVSNASHELKTPLTRALLSTDIALNQPVIQKGELENVKNDLLEINELLEKLLLLSKVRETSMLPQGNTKVIIVVNEILKSFSKITAEKKITVKVGIAEDFTFPVHIKYLQIILSNLLSNAIKFSNEESTINITGSKNEYSKTISVQNLGKVLSTDETQKIFDRFYRGKEQNEKGHGIGLSLVKRICDSYDITIKVTSEENNGTFFVLESK